MSWTIGYEDGSTWSGDTPRSIPQERRVGVEFIYQGHEHDRLFNKDFYLYREDYGCWIDVDWFGLIDHLLVAAHFIPCVLAGRTIPRAAFAVTMAKMNKLSEA